MAAVPCLNAAPMGFKTRMQCPRCHERLEAGTGSCYCNELHRRTAYDQERERRGLVPLYRPPSMR